MSTTILPPPMSKKQENLCCGPILHNNGLKLRDCHVGMRIRNLNYVQNGEGTITKVLHDTIEVMWDVMGRIEHAPSALQYFVSVDQTWQQSFAIIAFYGLVAVIVTAIGLLFYWSL